jgi:hypothetical protein
LGNAVAAREAVEVVNKTTRWAVAVSCFLVAFVFLVQVLGLLFIQRIAVKAADPNSEVRIPLSVRFVGVVADKLHRDVLKEPLDPDGSNWPSGFRWFFALEICGLAGICIAFAQLGAGVLKQEDKWKVEARTILMSSCLTLLVGVGFLKLIPPNRETPPPPQRIYEIETTSQSTG